MVSDVRNALGGMWEGGKCVPPPPGGEKKICPSFGYEESCGRSSGVTKSRAVEVFYLMALLCGGGSSAPQGGPPPRPPSFNCTLFRLAIRPSTALVSHETVLGSAVPSPATPPAPCCFQIIRSGLQQVRFLRKLMPGEGFYMNVLWCIIKAWKRCAVPAAIASCCHESICAFVASRPALTRY